MNFPKTIEIKLQSEVFDNFRCQVAANSLDIDVKKKSIHHLLIKNIEIPQEWNVALIYGSSGSGKTTLVKQLFGENIFDIQINEDEPIINQMPENLTYEECANLLNGIGLNTVPCWIRPVKTLSNGQRARAEAVLLMCRAIENEIVFIDEWTSVVDRTVAKAMSLCLSKFAKRNNKKIVLLSCHYDIIEWLLPDWLIDCNKQEFILPKGEDFFFNKREQIEFTIKEIDNKSWKYFSKYHYLSDRIPGGKNYLYGLFYGENQIGFQCFSNYVPKVKGRKWQFHSNRTVVHPDYNGLGLGIKLINETSILLYEKLSDENFNELNDIKDGFKIAAKFSSTPVFKAMIKQKCWKFIKEERTMGLLNKKAGNNKFDRGKRSAAGKSTGFREGGVKTYHFEFSYRLATSDYKPDKNDNN
jgi:energy-coupling factor transporter ATP-binding protein EcfA2